MGKVHVKKGDMVRTQRQGRRERKVLDVDHIEHKVVVEGVNIVTSMLPRPNKGFQADWFTRKPIYADKVAHLREMRCSNQSRQESSRKRWESADLQEMRRRDIIREGKE